MAAAAAVTAAAIGVEVAANVFDLRRRCLLAESSVGS